MAKPDPQAVRLFLSDGKRRIEDALDQVVPLLGAAPPALHEAMRYTLLLPGKRLRGILTLAASEMLKGEAEDAMPSACAVEMVHAASLILGDLPSMDGATLRRGKPVLHRVAGEAHAILAAFALLNSAFALILESGSPGGKARRESVLRLTRAVGGEGLVGGQFAEMESAGTRVDLDVLERIHTRRAGALFVAAAELGGLAAGGRRRELEALGRYAAPLGLAFQVSDDLLDYSGNPETTGKDAGRERDRTTFVNLCGIDGARRRVDDLVERSLAALSPFGRRAGMLRALAEHVRGRDR
jgi:geranylgeranyl diphosphate synthase type II